MSLQVWLPLNGNANNQGLLDNVNSTGLTFTAGKIGQAMVSGNISMSAAQTAKVLNNNEVSIAFWCKVFNNVSTSGILFGNNPMGTDNNRKFTIFNYPDMNSLHWSWMNDEASTTFAGGVINNFFPTDTWTHCTIVYKNPMVYIYKNGTLIGTHTDCISNSSTFQYDTNIITGNANRAINDFRIYNHALSNKEVKELAKGLILHYTFNDISMQNTVYDSSGYRYDATVIGPEYYKMKPTIKNLLGNPNEFSLSNITNNSDDLTYTPNVLAMANYDLPTPIVGHKYYGRVEQLVPPNTSFADGRFEYFVTDAGGTGNVVFTSFSEAVQDNQWHMYSSIQQFTGLYAQSGYYMRSFSVNATNTSKRRNHMIIDLTDAFGEGNEPTKEWCDENIPYFTGTLSNFRHPNPGRGSAVLHSIGNPSAKILTTLNPSFITNGTLVVWYKKDSSAMNYNSGNFLMATQANSGQYLCATNGDSPPFNGSCSYNHWYVDGIEQNKSNFMDTNWHMYSPTGINLSSWTSLSFHAHGDDSWLYRGDIAEIRLYNTELSADDIKELYETSASIDKNGNLYCREIVEV